MKILMLLFNFLNVFNFNSTYNTEVVLESLVDVENIYSVNEECYITNVDNSSYLSYLDEEYFIENYTISKTLDTINNIYLVASNKNCTTIITFNKFNKKITYKAYDGLYIENIYDINDSIYIIGNEYNDGVIYNLSYDLEVQSKRLFISDGFITVNHLVYDDKYFYITIFKDGITNNSEFINHGNVFEQKSVLVKLNDKFNILDSYYFNENSTCEIIKNIYVSDNKIKVLLKTNTKYYIYNFNNFLDTPTCYEINTKDDVELLNHYKSRRVDLLLNKTNSSLYTSSPSGYLLEYDLNVFGKICDYNFINGNLYLYFLNNGFRIIKLLEYEVIKQEDKVLNYFNLDYLDTSNMIVESWFSKLDIEVEVVTPFFDKSMCGKYEIVYKILKDKDVVCHLYNDLIVDEYTNFINNGIYNVGKVLEFFGTAILNGERIYYGAKIDTPGEYDIEITNINGEVKNYHIYIVSNYYKEESIKHLDATYVYNDTAYVNIELNNQEVKEIIVDNERYENYEIIEDVLVLSFPYSSIRVESFMLNGIVFVDNEEEYFYRINKVLTFNYLKHNPSITINKTIEENSFILNLNVEDIDKTFMCVKACYGGNEQNMKEMIISSDQVINASYLKLFLVYDLGNGIPCEVLISEVKQNEVSNSKIAIRYEDGILKNINIVHDLKTENLSILNVIGNENSYLEYYDKIKPNSYLKSIIIISTVIFIGSGIVFGGYVILKKSKKKSF